MATAIPYGWQVENASGTPVSGAKIYFYAPGTTTPRATYTDTALTVPAANPVVANSAGWFNTYLSSELAYDVLIKSADDSITYQSRTIASNISGAQPVDATLTALAGLGLENRKFIRGTGVDTAENVTLSAAAGSAFLADYASLQAAITAASAVKQEVVIPAGATVVSATLTHTTGQVKLRGTDAGTNGTRLTTTLNGPIFEPTAECTVQGIGFIGSNDAAKTAQVGIKLDDVNNVHIRECVFDELYTAIRMTDTVFYTQIKDCKFFSSKGPMIVGDGSTSPGFALQLHGNEIIPTAILGSVLDFSNLGSINSSGNVISPANATGYCLRVRTMATAAGIQQFSNDVFEGSNLSAINLEGASSAAPCRYFYFSNCYANQSTASEPTLLLKHIRTLHWVGGYISGTGSGIKFNAGNASDIHIGPVRFELNSSDAAITAAAGSDIRGLHLKGVTLDGGSQRLLDLSAMAAADLDNITIDATTKFGNAASPVLMPTGAYAKLNWRHGNKFMATKNGTDQTGIASATATKITFGTEVYDVRDRFASSTWSPYTGVQRITCHIYATNVTAGAACELKLYKNGSEYLRGPITNGSASNDVMMEATWEFLSEPGDTFDVYIRATSPGTVTINGGTSLTYITGSQV